MKFSETALRLLRYARSSYGPLNKNTAHQLAAQHALCHYASHAVYSFIPKNACSTMRLSLAIANGCIPGPDAHVWIHKNNGAFVADLRALATAKFTFVLLREPLRRLASVYLDKIVERTSEYWILNDLTDRRHQPDEMTFRRFVEYLGGGFLSGNIHWRPQVDFLVYEDYDLWASVESFSDYQSQITERTGMLIHDARPLTRHGNEQYKQVDHECYADTPPRVIREMRNEGLTPRLLSLFDEPLARAASRLYKNDIDLYNSKLPNQRVAD